MSISLPTPRTTVPEPARPGVVVPFPASPAGADGSRAHLPVLRGPGVYPPQRDTWLLADVLVRELHASPLPRRTVLELCSGTGALSLVAAGVPGTDVTAVDVSRRALVSAWANARRLGRRVRLHRGDLVAPVVGKRYDLVVSNPPYVPAADASLPTHGAMRAFDGGLDGRAVVDRVIDSAPRVLAPGGCLLLVHSAVNGIATTLDRLTAHGLDAEVAARCEHPFGPVFTARAELLERRGLIERGQRTEELVVIRARRRQAVGTRGSA